MIWHFLHIRQQLLGFTVAFFLTVHWARQTAFAAPPVGSHRSTAAVDEIGIDVLKEAFVETDTDRNGLIDPNEFSTSLKSAYGGDLSDAELLNIFIQADTNSDGMIDMEEYICWARRIEMRRAQFMSVDLDSNGFIDLDEWRQAVARMKWQLSAEDVDKAFELADTNKDGQISFFEFVKWK
eukprot:TRINITY_DN32652_c0_g1_i1.p1 TRINITY_DN32652_c0_g1~~TRINITY_DN32652_c0_g1_i1.p1  ORF type:complete len:181 (-),score=35.52 TRINITY_DN32652_c0_g1_i1:56-598(-)